MLEVNWDPPSLLRVFGTPKIPTHDKNALTKSLVEVLFAGYRPTNFEKLSTMRMIYLIPASSSGKGPRVSMEISDNGATLYRWCSTISSQFAGRCHLIF
jgi:hypothetical protein